MRGAGSGLALLLLSACGPDTADGERLNPVEQRAADVSPEPTQPPVETQAVETLAGEWRVAGIDGTALDQPTGIALSADADEIWWEPRCAGIVRTYRIEGMRIALDSPSAPPPPETSPPVPPPAICTIGLPPRMGEVNRVLNAADTIVRTPENGIELSGGGHSLTLFSQ